MSKQFRIPANPRVNSYTCASPWALKYLLISLDIISISNDYIIEGLCNNILSDYILNSSKCLIAFWSAFHLLHAYKHIEDY